MEIDWNVGGIALLLWIIMSAFLFVPKMMGMEIFPIWQSIGIMIILLPISYFIVQRKMNG